MQHIKPAFARFDPAHAFDGLFVPTGGQRRGRLFTPQKTFGGVKINFQGFEQLGADDQSVLLAISAQLGIGGQMIDGSPLGPIGQQLRAGMSISSKKESIVGEGGDDGSLISSRKTTLHRLLIDAGYAPGSSTDKIAVSLNRLRNAQIRWIDKGVDRVANLISTAFDNETGGAFVATNPRLTKAVFAGQHVKISLLERAELDGEVAKLLHCWFCSNIRLGQSLGRGNGAHIDTLAPHVWGGGWDGFTTQAKSNKRALLREALVEISEKTQGLNGGYGWVIERAGSVVLVSRPKSLPFVESDLGRQVDFMM